MSVDKKLHKRSLESTGKSVESVEKKKKQSERPQKRAKINNVADEKKKISNLELDKSHVASCIKAILKLDKMHSDKKKALFSEEDNPILLQINCIKIPKVPHHYERIVMPHQMVGDSDEVALFVADLERGRRKDHEPTIEHWETKLREKGVTRKITIIPMNQVKNEYGQFEMKRRLARMYDFFLVDGRISGHMTHILGKAFTRFSMAPIPIHVDKADLKKQIEVALKKASLEIHGNGNSHIIKVAKLAMSRKEILNNIMVVCEKLKIVYPGGLNNIRSILIKTRQGLGIPIYYSMKRRNKVKTPDVAPKRPKAYEIVEGELSTIEADVKVQVTPDGTIKIKSSD